MRAATSVKRRRGALAGATALIALALGSGSAQAATMTLGNPLSNPSYGISGFSGGPYTLLNTTLISGLPPGSPVDGTVISWGVGRPDGEFGLQVLRPVGAFYRATGQSTVGQLVFDPLPSPQQPTSLPIAKGDVIALRTGGGTALAQANAGASARLAPALVPGGAVSGPPAATDPVNNYGFNATVRYCEAPKLKGTKKKKVRKVLTGSDCAAGEIRTLKKAGRGCVLRAVGQFPKPGTAISDTEGVDVTLAPRCSRKARKRG